MTTQRARDRDRRRGPAGGGAAGADRGRRAGADAAGRQRRDPRRPPHRPLPGGRRPDLAVRAVAAAGDELDVRGRHDVHRRLRALRRADRPRAVDVGLGPGPARRPAPGGDLADLGPELATELRALTAATFPSRRLQSAYLGWVLRHVIANLPTGVRVHVHECRATGLTEDGAAQLVHLDGGATLRVDAVVLASGHLDATPTDAELELAARAAAAGLRYLPPEQTTDTDLSVHRAGRAGHGPRNADWPSSTSPCSCSRAAAAASSRTRTRPAASCATSRPAREPVLHVGSPRGLALPRQDASTRCAAAVRRLPRFLGPESVDPLVAAGRRWTCAPRCGR